LINGISDSAKAAGLVFCVRRLQVKGSFESSAM
jgi:hypothetical protein